MAQSTMSLPQLTRPLPFHLLATTVVAMLGVLCLSSPGHCADSRLGWAPAQAGLSPEGSRTGQDTQSTAYVPPASHESEHSLGLIFTGKLVAGSVSHHVLHESESFGVAGFGGQLSFPLLHHKLELEVGGAMLDTPFGPVYPVDLMIGYVFHVRRWLEPYVSLGPSMSIAQSEVIPGLATSGGVNVWTKGHFGLHADAVYAQFYDHSDLSHEVNGGLGLSYRY